MLKKNMFWSRTKLKQPQTVLHVPETVLREIGPSGVDHALALCLVAARRECVGALRPPAGSS